jgi:hypothetical protein
MVKTKLVELGEYIGKNRPQTERRELKVCTLGVLMQFKLILDDQLTEYVMIMVTNKKSEKQMADDLELFLGGPQKANEFSAW